MTYSDEIKVIIYESAQQMHRNPEWRWGQSIFNTAWLQYSDIVRDTPGFLDPFQNDDKVGMFLRWLEYKIGEVADESKP